VLENRDPTANLREEIEVGDDRVRHDAVQERLRLRNAGGVEHGSTLPFQDDSDHIAQIVVVVDHQDRKAGACGATLFVRKHGRRGRQSQCQPEKAESAPNLGGNPTKCAGVFLDSAFKSLPSEQIAGPPLARSLATMERIHVFQTPVMADGVVYRAEAWGDERDDGLFEGWLRFIPPNGWGILFTGRETTQPSRGALVYWATGLEPVYLEGAFERATRRRSSTA
jgi:hypothetical protein